MVFIRRQEAFICEHCGHAVEPLQKGSCRNHCPACLWSKHVDRDGPGDRSSECLGMMEPIAIDSNGKKGWMIVHRCLSCQKQIRNKAAPDDDLGVVPPPRGVKG